MLKPNGLFLLHTIAGTDSRRFGDPWINKYIFPNSMLPSLSQIHEASRKLWSLEDLHNFGADYDKTLMAWHQRFIETCDKNDIKFNRMWSYYLLFSAGMFRARKIHLYQMIFTKQLAGGYISVR